MYYTELLSTGQYIKNQPTTFNWRISYTNNGNTVSQEGSVDILVHLCCGHTEMSQSAIDEHNSREEIKKENWLRAAGVDVDAIKQSLENQ